MSRSRKKAPVTGITAADSEKEDKQLGNRRLRRITREKIKKGNEELPGIREVSDVWQFSKDGKSLSENDRHNRK